MNTPALGRPATAASSLEPYAQLLRALLPRMDTLSVFNARGELYWASEGAVGPEVSGIVPLSISTAEKEPAAAGEQRLARDEILNLQSSMLEQDNDLEMLLSVSGGGDTKAENGNDLKAIIASA